MPKTLGQFLGADRSATSEEQKNYAKYLYEQGQTDAQFIDSTYGLRRYSDTLKPGTTDYFAFNPEGQKQVGAGAEQAKQAFKKATGAELLGIGLDTVTKSLVAGRSVDDSLRQLGDLKNYTRFSSDYGADQNKHEINSPEAIMAKSFAAQNMQSAPTAPPSPANPASPSSTYQGPSIVDYLKSVGQKTDFNSRAAMARGLGITNYSGTAAQNTQLLNSLRQGGASGGSQLGKEAVASPGASPGTTGATPSITGGVPSSQAGQPSVPGSPGAAATTGTETDPVKAAMLAEIENLAKQPSAYDQYLKAYKDSGLSDAEAKVQADAAKVSEIEAQIAQIENNINQRIQGSGGLMTQEAANRLATAESKPLLSKLDVYGRQLATSTAGRGSAQDRLAQLQAQQTADQARQQQLLSARTQMAGYRSPAEIQAAEMEKYRQQKNIDLESSELKYYPATENSPGGIFDPATGKFTPTSGGGGGGAIGWTPTPTLTTPTAPKQTFEQYLAEQEKAKKMSFGPAQREALKKEFDAQLASAAAAAPPVSQDLSIYAFPVQDVIRGKATAASIMTGGTARERALYDKQLKDAMAKGLLRPEDTLSDAQRTTFLNITAQRERSPLIRASDRTPVLKSSIAAIRANPSDGALQMNLGYSYIQALDTYQSAVREGELKNVNSIDSKIGQFQNVAQQMTNGQIVRPEVAKQMASAAEQLVITIDKEAKTKDKSFASQANVLGIDKAWQKYLDGFTPSYNTPIGGGSTGTGGGTTGQTSTGLKYTIIP